MTATEILLIVKKRFWLIVAGAVVAGAVAFVLTLLWPAAYEARALLLITKLRPSVTLDPRYETVAEENVVNLSIQEDQVRRQTLVGLTDSADLLRRVVERLGDTLAETEQSAAFLRGVTKIDTVGNLISFTARADTPTKAADIANAWASVYQEQVNRLYSATSPSLEQIEVQLQTAQADYEQAASDLEAFLRQSQERELTRRIEQKQKILADLQTGQLSAARQQVDALLSSVNRYEQLLFDAESLKALLAGAEATAPLTPGEQFALFSLEALAFGKQELPVQVEIGPGWLDLPDLTAGEAIQHLDRVVDTIETARERAQAEVNRLSLDLLSGRELLTYESGDRSSEGIAELQSELNALTADLELQTREKQDLENARDVAEQSYLTLLRKSAEVRIQSELTGVEVQVAASAQPPERPATPGPIIPTGLGLLGGGLAGLALAFLVEVWPGKRQPSSA